MKVTVCRKTHFNAAHRLCNPKWDDSVNQKVYGICSSPNFHGHNYDLIVKVKGEIDHDTGYVIDMKTLKAIVEKNIIEKFLNPTAENIAVTIWNILRLKIESKFELEVVLYETERNFVEYSGE